MPYLPQDWGVMTTAIRAWVVGQLAGYTVVWNRTDAPAPPAPFASLGILASPQGLGRPQSELIYTGGPSPSAVERLERDTELVVSVQLFRKVTPGEAPELINPDAIKLAESVYRFDVREAFNAAGLAFVATNGPQQIPGIAGAKWEQRSALDVRMRARTRVDTAISWLENLVIGTVSVPPGVQGTLST